jgi:hypothetical protein
MSLSTSLSDTSIEQLAAVINQSIIMEPIFAATTSETVTAQLQEQLDKAVAAVPPAHRLNPSRDEVVESKEAAFSRLQDWAFVKGCAIVKESAKSKGGQVNRLYLDCAHCKKATRNSRKLKETERQRHQTKIQANNCLLDLLWSGEYNRASTEGGRYLLGLAIGKLSANPVNTRGSVEQTSNMIALYLGFHLQAKSYYTRFGLRLSQKEDARGEQRAAEDGGG